MGRGGSTKTTGAAASAICRVVRRACCEPQRPKPAYGAGVSYEQLRTQTTQAIKACEAAAQHPKDLTSQYQLARAVELVDPARGQAMQDRLVKLGFPAAFDHAGSLLLNDPTCRQHCISGAGELVQKR